MTANDSKSDLAYLNKLVSRWIVIIVLLIKKTCWCSLFHLTEKIEASLKSPEFKFGDRIR